MHSDKANYEALINIFANGTEIFLMQSGALFLLGAFSLLFLRKWKTAGKFALSGIVSIPIGLAFPGVVNVVVVSIKNSNTSPDTGLAFLMVPVFIGFLLLIAGFFRVFFLPTSIARHRKKINEKQILVLNILLGLIPLGWNVVLFMSYMNDKETKQEAHDDTQREVTHES
ncbi:superinfection immunity protein [bacterium]|nr:superinfection immunity protein [bacterium]